MNKKMSIKNVVKVIFISIIMIEVTIGCGLSEIVFSDNFDSHDDWEAVQQLNPNDLTCPGASGCTSLPAGWDQYRVASQRPCSNTDGGHNTMIIDSTNRRGTSGKGFTYWSEDCLSHDGSWGSDGLLTKKLNSTHQELYVRLWIKFQSDWKWNADSSQKFLHMTHKGESDSWYDFFSDTENKPRVFFNYTFYSFTTDTNHNSLISWYDNGGSKAVHEYVSPFASMGEVGDGEWHRLDFHVKNNSATGTADGIWETWLDGVLITQETNVEWVGSGSVSSRGWNTIHLGGNNYNLNLGNNNAEQWYAIDDLIVSTTPIDDNHSIMEAPTNLIIIENN